MNGTWFVYYKPPKGKEIRTGSHIDRANAEAGKQGWADAYAKRHGLRVGDVLSRMRVEYDPNVPSRLWDKESKRG